MALRHPVYLDAETLLALADYFELGVAPSTDVVERSIDKRSASGKAGWSVMGVGGEVGKDVEFQTSYTITPNEKATVSKVIDKLIADSHVVEATPDAILVRDDIIEVDGTIRLTAASIVAKVFFALKKLLESNDQNLGHLNFEDIEPDLIKQIQKIYLGSELVPIPLLVEVTKTGLGPRVFVNLRPNLFVEAATSEQIEGERKVLGSVRNLVSSDSEGYLSTDEWLLPNWDYLMKRILMAEIGDKVRELTDALDLDLPSKDVSAWIKGPAVVIDAIAVY